MSDIPAPTPPSGLGGPVTAAPPVALRSALLDAIGRRRRRIRSRLAVAGLVCLAVAAAVLAGGVFTGGPERVLAIDEGNEWVTVRILDGEAGAAEMTRELQDAGIDGEVQLVPSIPQFVGHWMGVGQVDQAPRDCDLNPVNETPRLTCTNPPLLSGGNAEFHGDVFQIRRDAIPKLAEAHTIFYIGREPEPGETALEFPPDDRHTSSVPLGP